MFLHTCFPRFLSCLVYLRILVSLELKAITINTRLATSKNKNKKKPFEITLKYCGSVRYLQEKKLYRYIYIKLKN